MHTDRLTIPTRPTANISGMTATNTVWSHMSTHKHPPTISVVQQQLNSLWTELLLVEQIDPDLDFVSLGGDSLAAMMCISRIRQMYDVELTLEDFFLDTATLRNMAITINGLLPEMNDDDS